MKQTLDVLANLEIQEELTINGNKSTTLGDTSGEIFESSEGSFFSSQMSEELELGKSDIHTLENDSVGQSNTSENTKKVEKQKLEERSGSSIIAGSVFFIKYMCTSFLIFGVLMVVSNYSAYGKLLYSIIYANELQQTGQSMVDSVSASSIETVKESKEQIHTFQALGEQETQEIPHEAPNIHSLTKLITQTESKDIDLGIEITPYDNRIVIPKIGKNIPLIDIENREISGIDELNDIFMDELEGGVIRYPGSALPGQNGNSFIFGHSSNFPWMKGEYNDVFALLDKLSDGDEIIVYYNQEKYTYIVSKKDVIRPGNVSVLQNTNKEKKELNLMTCWPIGTTLNRLVVSAHLSSVEK